MDSLTQVVLGAACGEVVLGRKVGNRAMVWGAIGGTIPDLDVLSSLFTDEMSALAFHRGFMHSLLFGVLAPVVLAFVVFHLYDSGFYRRLGYKRFVAASQMVGSFAVVLGINFAVKFFSGHWNFISLLLMTGALVYFAGRRWQRYLNDEPAFVDASYWDWYWLFFWSIITHPLLDCFTNYGTQIFQPFSDYRVAFNTVSIVDPLYTVPFGLSLIVASFIGRDEPRRFKIALGGLLYSCAFLGLTVVNKLYVGGVFERSLAKQNIRYNRYMTNPSIFNNFLWYGVADGDTLFHYGMFSIFDSKPEIPAFAAIPKNRSLIKGHENDPDLRILRWFSNDYFALLPGTRDTVMMYDLRFGLLGEKYKGDKSFVFPFVLHRAGPYLEAHQRRDPPGNNGEASNAFSELWSRIKGR